MSHDDQTTIRYYLDGLIRRDVSCGTPIPDDDPYWATPEGARAKADAAATRGGRDGYDCQCSCKCGCAECAERGAWKAALTTVAAQANAISPLAAPAPLVDLDQFPEHIALLLASICRQMRGRCWCGCHTVLTFDSMVYKEIRRPRVTNERNEIERQWSDACVKVQFYVQKYGIGKPGDSVFDNLIADAERLRKELMRKRCFDHGRVIDSCALARVHKETADE